MTDATPFEGLKSALAARVEQRTISLRVPKTEVFVKYRAFTQGEIKRIRNRFLKPGETSAQAMENAGVKANPVILAETCEGIYLRVDGKLVPADPEGSAPTFDARLVELLGAPEQEDTSSIVRLLFNGNDFDIAAAVAKVSDFSGGAEAEVFEDAAGD